jgi:hypothetical protein
MALSGRRRWWTRDAGSGPSGESPYSASDASWIDLSPRILDTYSAAFWQFPGKFAAT